MYQICTVVVRLDPNCSKQKQTNTKIKYTKYSVRACFQRGLSISKGFLSV